MGSASVTLANALYRFGTSAIPTGAATSFQFPSRQESKQATSFPSILSYPSPSLAGDHPGAEFHLPGYD